MVHEFEIDCMDGLSHDAVYLPSIFISLLTISVVIDSSSVAFRHAFVYFRFLQVRIYKPECKLGTVAYDSWYNLFY